MNYWLIAYFISVIISLCILLSSEIRVYGKLYFGDLVLYIFLALLPIVNLSVIASVIAQTLGKVIIWEKSK